MGLATSEPVGWLTALGLLDVDAPRSGPAEQEREGVRPIYYWLAADYSVQAFAAR